MTSEVAEFRARAERFCRLIETADSLDLHDFFERAIVALGELCASATRLHAEPVLGSLADGLADIHHDLTEGLGVRCSLTVSFDPPTSLVPRGCRGA